VTVLYKYEATCGDELDVKEGETLDLVKEDDADW